MQQKIGKYYASGREFSLKNRHHRMVLILSVMIAVPFFVSRLTRGDPFYDSTLAAINMGLAMLVAWGITREIDPDRPDSAFAAAALTAVGITLLDTPSNLVAGYALVMVSRAVSRSTGVRFKIVDVLITVILLGLTARTDQWVLGLVAGLGFWLDSVAENPSRYARINAVIVVVMTLVIAYLSESLEWSFVLTNSDFAALITAVVVTRFVVPTYPDPVESVGDYTGKPLDRRRVLYTITLMALALILVSWSGGDDTVFGMMPLWAGLLALIVYHWRERIGQPAKEAA